MINNLKIAVENNNLNMIIEEIKNNIDGYSNK